MAASGFMPNKAIGGAIGGGMIGAGMGSFFGGYKDPSKGAMEHLDNIPDELRRYFEPYINRGNQMGDLLQDEYGNLIKDPGGRLNEIGGGYQQSPGFQFAIQQAMQGANNASASGGMAGSPQHTQQNMELATNLANQDYNTWIQNAMGLHGRGMGGAESMYGIGAQAGMGLGENLASVNAQKANMAYAGQAGENQRRSQGWSNLFGGAGALMSFL